MRLNLILICFFLTACGGGGGSSGSSSVSQSNTTNSAGGSFSSGTSESYNSSTASTWAGRQEFDNILYTDTNYTWATSVQNPYEVMNVHKAYGYGLSGDGITIHVQDSAFDKDHHEFNGKTVSLYQTNYTNDSTSSYHGNWVSSVAVGDYNGISTGNLNTSQGSMMGVAYNADLYYSDYNKRKSGVTDWAKDWGDALDDSPNATIASNHSYGILNTNIATVKNYMTSNSLSAAQTIEVYLDAAGYTTTTANAQGWIDSINSFQTNKGAIVWALSNEDSHTEAHWFAGLPELDSSLKDAWITVGTVDILGTSGNTTYTKKYSECGSTASYCLVTDSYGTAGATYENVHGGSVDDDNGSSYYTAGTGNSFGAPMVSGSLALLKEAFSSLTPAELTARLFATADNTFFTSDAYTTFSNGVRHGFSAKYGHGIPDIYKALQPITSNMLGNSILVGESVSNSQSYSFENTSLNLGSAFGDSVSNAVANEVGFFHDALYGYFGNNFSKSVNNKVNKDKTNLENFNDKLSYKKMNTEQDGTGFNYIGTYSPENFSENSYLDPTKGFSFSSSIAKDKELITSYKLPLELSLGFVPIESQHAGKMNDSGFRIPFIQESSDSFSFGSTIYNNNKKKLSLGFFQSDKNLGIDKEAMVASYSFSGNDSHNSLILGISNEQDSFLNSTSAGAYGYDNSVSPTNFAAISHSKKFTPNVELLATGSIGFTKIDMPENKLLSNISNVISSNFGVAINFSNISNTKDNLSFGISQPHRIENGNANLLIPGARDVSGNLTYTSKDISLAPSGRQIDFEVAYSFDINDNTSLAFKNSLSNNAQHTSSNGLSNTFYSSFNYKF